VPYAVLAATSALTLLVIRRAAPKPLTAP